MRGEYLDRIFRSPPRGELPPRARRIPATWAIVENGPRTTSACAENTSWVSPAHSPVRNYLRVRGEYITVILSVAWVLELPPRARRIHPNLYEWDIHLGTTSACAENTGGCLVFVLHDGNYLRVRGEYNSFPTITDSRMELPPRARRILRIL